MLGVRVQIRARHLERDTRPIFFHLFTAKEHRPCQNLFCRFDTRYRASCAIRNLTDEVQIDNPLSSSISPHPAHYFATPIHSVRNSSVAGFVPQFYPGLGRWKNVSAMTAAVWFLIIASCKRNDQHTAELSMAPNLRMLDVGICFRGRAYQPSSTGGQS